MFLVSWLAIVGLTVCGGVLAARRVGVDCPAAAKAALIKDLASLPAMQDLPLASGRIVAVNAKAGTITVRHGEIRRHELDPMTRVFAVDDKDKVLLASLAPGDKVRFDLVRKNGRYTIDRLEHSN
jgi:Cu/Ag efflux protein CusF